MPLAHLCKITRDTTIWKKGQKVWVFVYSGDLAYKAIGRFKGNGRWITGWVHIEVPSRPEFQRSKPNARWVGSVEVKQEFYDMLKEKLASIVKNKYIFNDGF